MKIKGTEKKENVIELQDDGEGDVVVKVNGQTMARYWNGGNFTFYGRRDDSQYEGKWKLEEL